jgi:hypothetical protein
MQEHYVFGDIYDAVEDAFCIYLLCTQVDIDTFVDSVAKISLQNHYNEAYSVYLEIILFIKNNKI